VKQVTIDESNGSINIKSNHNDLDEIELSCPIAPVDSDEECGCTYLRSCNKYCAWFDLYDEVRFDNKTHRKSLVSFVECKGVRIAQVIRYADKPAEEKLTSESGGDA